MRSDARKASAGGTCGAMRAAKPRSPVTETVLATWYSQPIVLSVYSPGASGATPSVPVMPA